MLIHWDAGDTYGTSSDSLLGYWSVLWRGTVCYYYFCAKAAGCSYSKPAGQSEVRRPTLPRGAVTGSESTDRHRLSRGPPPARWSTIRPTTDPPAAPWPAPGTASGSWSRPQSQLSLA